MLAFASLVGESLVRAAGPAALDAFGQDAIDPRKLDHPARAKRVIFLFMNGGLSQVDSFDPKPMLDKYHGQPLPGGTIATERKTGALMRSPFTFKKYGKCGHGSQRAVPARRRLRRRHLLHPLDLHRHPEPRAVDADDEHRPHAGRPAVARLVAHLRARHRQQEPARASSCSAPTCRRRSGRRCGTTRSCRPCTRGPSSPTRSRSSPTTRSSARTSIRRSSSRTSTTRSSR